MKKNINFFSVNMPIVLFVGFMLAGCGSQTKNVPSDYSLQNDATKGLVAVSLTFENIPYIQSLGFNLRSVDKKFDSTVAAFDMFMDDYWKKYYVEEEKGRLVVVELDPGEYEFYSWVGSMGGFGGTSTIYSTKEFSKKFTVTTGSIIYIGNIHMTVSGLGKIVKDEKGIYGVIVKDRRDKDLPAVFTNWPRLRREDLIIEIMQ